MPIYVSKTYGGKVESVVLANSYELANAFWQGKGFQSHSTLTYTERDLDEHPTGVLPIVDTKKKKEITEKSVKIGIKNPARAGKVYIEGKFVDLLEIL